MGDKEKDDANVEAEKGGNANVNGGEKEKAGDDVEVEKGSNANVNGGENEKAGDDVEAEKGSNANVNDGENEKDDANVEAESGRDANVNDGENEKDDANVEAEKGSNANVNGEKENAGANVEAESGRDANVNDGENEKDDANVEAEKGSNANVNGEKENAGANVEAESGRDANVNDGENEKDDAYAEAESGRDTHANDGENEKDDANAEAESGRDTHVNGGENEKAGDGVEAEPGRDANVNGGENEKAGANIEAEPRRDTHVKDDENEKSGASVEAESERDTHINNGKEEQTKVSQQESAATVIQARVRGQLSRNALADLLVFKEAGTFPNIWELYEAQCATIIEKIARGFLVRKAIEDWSTHAAVLIQAVARGMLAKRRVSRMAQVKADWKRERATAKAKITLRRHALVIQCAWRAFVARKRVVYKAHLKSNAALKKFLLGIGRYPELLQPYLDLPDGAAATGHAGDLRVVELKAQDIRADPGANVTLEHKEEQDTVTGICAFQKRRLETGDLYMCTATAVHRVRLPLCGWHQPRCICEHKGERPRIKYPNELGMCPAHYAKHTGRNFTPQKFDNWWDLPCVVVNNNNNNESHSDTEEQQLQDEHDVTEENRIILEKLAQIDHAGLQICRIARGHLGRQRSKMQKKHLYYLERKKLWGASAHLRREQRKSRLKKRHYDAIALDKRLRQGKASDRETLIQSYRKAFRRKKIARKRQLLLKFHQEMYEKQCWEYNQSILEVFDKMDDDGNGHLTRTEIINSLTRKRLVREFIESRPKLRRLFEPKRFGSKLFAVADSDNSGAVDRDEFLQWCLNVEFGAPEENTDTGKDKEEEEGDGILTLRWAYAMMNPKQKEALSRREISQALQTDSQIQNIVRELPAGYQELLHPKSCRRILLRIDKNGDGKITEQEWISFCQEARTEFVKRDPTTSMLLEIFEIMENRPDGSGDGTISKKEFYKCLATRKDIRNIIMRLPQAFHSMLKPFEIKKDIFGASTTVRAGRLGADDFLAFCTSIASSSSSTTTATASSSLSSSKKC
eukprot:g3971.t1